MLRRHRWRWIRQILLLSGCLIWLFQMSWYIRWPLITELCSLRWRISHSTFILLLYHWLSGWIVPIFSASWLMLLLFQQLLLIAWWLIEPSFLQFLTNILVEFNMFRLVIRFSLVLSRWQTVDQVAFHLATVLQLVVLIFFASPLQAPILIHLVLFFLLLQHFPSQLIQLLFSWIWKDKVLGFWLLCTLLFRIAILFLILRRVFSLSFFQCFLAALIIEFSVY